MTPEPQREATSRAPRPVEIDTCPNCRAALLPGMRFCRTCGFRLGEGVAEYAETVRLDGMPTMSATRPDAQTFGIPAMATNSLAARQVSRRRAASCGRGGAGWFTWVFVAALVGGAMGGGSALVQNIRRAAAGSHIGSIVPSASRSFIGVGGTESVRGEGALLDAVLPGTPAERAGLRDGDLIKTFDGRVINSHDDMSDALRRTPVGKSIEVAYVRDGVAGSTKLTTVSPDDYDESASMPAGGTGYWGVDGLDRVAVEGTNIYGVRLGSVSSNRPADIAGLKRGDVVVEFNGNPVRTSDGLASYIHHAAPGSTAQVVVMRAGQRIELPVKMGKN
jgi:hypothetical protein